MNCPHCGTPTSDSPKYCRSCGMNLEGVARAVERHIAELSEPAEPQKKKEKREYIGKLMGLGAIALIFLLLAGFFINLALVGIAGVGISEAAFGKIAIALMAVALPLLFGGFGLIVTPVIFKELFKAKSTKRDRISQDKSLRELPPAARFDSIPSVVEHTTTELELRPPKP